MFLNKRKRNPGHTLPHLGPNVEFTFLPPSYVGLLRVRLFTVLYFFRKIVEIEPFALRAAILHECQYYLGGGGCLGGSEKNIFLAPLSLEL